MFKTKRLKKWRYSVGVGILFLPMLSPSVFAGSAPFVGDIMLFGGNFCPRGWASADGQLLAISSNDALFSLFGTIYGGDGRTTFGLPDLRGRIVVGEGQGAGLTNRRLGTKSGSNNFVVTASNLGGHSHAATTVSQFGASSAKGTASDPAGLVLSDDDGDNIYNNTVPNVTMNAASISSTTVVDSTGGAASTTSVHQPSLAITYCVALVGVYPSRN
jgi:microcystin-dependent protein